MNNFFYKLNRFRSSIGFLILFISGLLLISAKFTIKGRVYELLQPTPYSSTMMLTDSNQLKDYKLKPLDSVKIMIYNCSLPDLPDTVKPVPLAPGIYSNAEGLFSAKIKSPADSFRVGVVPVKKGYIARLLHFDYSKDKNIYEIYLIVVKYMKMR